MLRSLLGELAIAFSILAAFFFSLVFLLGVADNTKTQNSVFNQVPLQQAEVARWGQIPGDLGYFWTRTATIYSKQRFDSTQYNANVQGPYEFKTTRNFENTAWAPTKSCIDYTMKYTYSGVTESELDTLNLMPNLEGLSVWYQKTHKPDYWLAWQALTQTAQLMFTSNMITRYYAYNAFEFLFKDQSLVNQGVLASLSAQDQQTVYSDNLFGMDSTDKLSFWVLASEGGDQSEAWIEIVNYYNQKGIDLTTAMYQICGDQSLLAMIWKEQYQVLLNEPEFDQKVVLDEMYLTQIQWGQNSVLGNPNIMMQDVPVLESIGQSNFDGIFNAYPEFGVYLQSRGRLDLALQASQVASLLEQTTEGYQTLLNPDNMRSFFKQYEEKQFANLQTRFGFDSPEQCDYFYEYLGYLVQEQLLANAPIENYAMGQLMERTLNQTYSALNRTFHLEVVTRNLAQTINGSTGTLSCDYFVQQVDPTNYASICQNYNFSDVESIKNFVNATWYRNTTTAEFGGYYADQLMAQTGFTNQQMTDLFNPATPTSFGAYVSTTCASVAGKYGCANAQNCTSQELIDQQWGQSTVTNNPINNDPAYTPKQMTTAHWGQWPVYGCEVPVEYSYWMTQGASLTTQTVGKIQSAKTDTYGLLAIYNSQRYMNAYFTQNTGLLSEFQSVLGTDQFFPENMIYMIQGWLMEGSFRNYTTRDLAYGWESTLVNKANGGDYWQGADFDIEQWMTPIFTDQQGPMANTHYGLFSGSFTTDNVSGYRLNNGQAYLNKLIPIWNGTYFTQTPQQPNGAISNAQSMWFNAVSNGIQYPPMMTQAPVQMYNDRTIKVENYSYFSSFQVPTSVLAVQTFNGEWNDPDVGFTFNMPFFEESYECGSCTNTTQENAGTFQVKVQGKQYKWATENSQFDISIQPESGFVQSRNKLSTTVLLMQYYTNSTQPMQPSPVQPLPLIDLAPLVGQHVPIYDLKETFYADQTSFLQTLGYIADNTSKVRTTTIWMIVCTCLSLFAAVVLAISHRKNKQAETSGETSI